MQLILWTEFHGARKHKSIEVVMQTLAGHPPIFQSGSATDFVHSTLQGRTPALYRLCAAA